MTEYKEIPAYVKAIDNDLGIVTHLISVYGITDYGGDIAHKGMFTKTIQERKGRIRVIDNHQQGSIKHVIGKPIDLYEVGRESLPKTVLDRYPTATGGLMADTQFLMDTPEGEGAFKRIKAEAVTEFSFAYDTMDSDIEKTQEGTKVRNLRAVKLYEYGPVIFGMNDAAVSVSAKSEESKTEMQKWFEEKESGYMRRASAIRDAFYSARNSSSGSESDSETGPSKAEDSWYYVSDVFDSYVLVESYGKDAYYQVTYTEEQDGSFTFADKSAWVVGTLQFTATEMAEPTEAAPDSEPETEADSESSTSSKRKMFPILMAELQMLEVDTN